jgi:hypothetical protein
MEQFNRDEYFTVVDERISPFTSIPRRGVRAIREGKLDVREISVYVVLNMILDGVIRLGPDPDFPKAIAYFTGMTERQVINVYKKLAQKGLLTLYEDGVHVNN